MTVGEFCIENTQFCELCVFRKSGWVVGTTWIDCEDLSILSIPDSIKIEKVQKDEWGNLPITTEHGDKITIPCHYIDF